MENRTRNNDHITDPCENDRLLCGQPQGHQPSDEGAQLCLYHRQRRRYCRRSCRRSRRLRPSSMILPARWCRNKYGNTNGKYQEAEGPALTESFLADTGSDGSGDRPDRASGWAIITPTRAWTAWIIRSFSEADYLVNADESGYSRENILHNAAHRFPDEDRHGAVGEHILEIMRMARVNCYVTITE